MQNTVFLVATNYKIHWVQNAKYSLLVASSSLPKNAKYFYLDIGNLIVNLILYYQQLSFSSIKDLSDCNIFEMLIAHLHIFVLRKVGKRLHIVAAPL